MLSGFKQFILRGNVVDLAVGVVIGAAFGKVIDSVVKDLITPLIGMFGGQPDFSAPIPRDQWKTLRAEDQFDAVLYLGRGASPRVDLDPARCGEKAEFQEHLRRMTASGLPPPETDRLRKLCGL